MTGEELLEKLALPPELESELRLGGLALRTREDRVDDGVTGDLYVDLVRWEPTSSSGRFEVPVVVRDCVLGVLRCNLNPVRFMLRKAAEELGVPFLDGSAVQRLRVEGIEWKP